MANEETKTVEAEATEIKLDILPEDENRPVVVAGFQEAKGLEPVMVAKDAIEEKDDLVVLRKKDVKKEKKGITIEVPEMSLTSIVLPNMATELQNYLLTYGIQIELKDLQCFISSLTSHLIYIPFKGVPDYVARLSSYFCGSVYFAKAENDMNILRCCYSACRSPERAHFLLFYMRDDFYFPDFLLKYIAAPSSRVEMEMNEYINDIFIGKAKLPDNIFVIATGNQDRIPEPIERYYSIWNAKSTKVESRMLFYNTISMNSFKNMHKVMNPISDDIWNQMSALEDILDSLGFELSNKDSNHLDDYLVTLINQNYPQDQAMKALIQNRVIPMVQNEISVTELTEKLKEAGIYVSRKEI